MNERADAPACSNCRLPLAGRYCSACGQDSIPAETAWRSWKDQVGRLRRTLAALLLHPGELTQQHLCGGRVRYIPPFTLFLNTVALFFLVSTLIDFRLSSFLASTRYQSITDLVAQRAAAEHLTQAIFLEHADRRFQTVYTLCLSLISVAGYTVIARIFFRKHWHDWRGPITFALHFMAFVFIVYMPLATMAIHLIRGEGELRHVIGYAADWLGTLLVAGWFTMGIRRLFGDQWPWAAAKGIAITLLGLPINVLMWNAAIYTTLLTT